jgi:hypothetical protein
VVAPDGTSNPAKALVKLDTEGNHDASWVTRAAPEAYGMSLVNARSSADRNDESWGDRSLYLAAGGNDFVAAYPEADGGESAWMRDTSGAAQAIEKMHGKLVVGGHFWEVADRADVDCGHRSTDNAATLDPSYPNSPHYPNPDPTQPDDQCATRHGLAAYSLGGDLDPGWSPMLEGRYSLAWALHPEATPQGARLHVGGHFLTVHGVTQYGYVRFSYRDGEEQGLPPDL